MICEDLLGFMIYNDSAWKMVSHMVRICKALVVFEISNFKSLEIKALGHQ